MKKFKKTVSFILVFAMLFSPVSSVAFAKTEINGVYYENEQTIGIYSFVVNEDDEAVIVNCNTMREKVEIPSHLGGYPVKYIAQKAFSNCEFVEEFTVPEGVVLIDWSAFETCYNLKKINLPDSLMFIGKWAFAHCINLKSINIPSGVSEIGDAVFIRCDSLESITCSEENEFFSSIDGVLFSKDKTKLLLYPQGNKRVEYKVPDGVKVISDSAFYDAKEIRSIILPDGIEKIEDQGFRSSDLTKINLPESLTEIGEVAFYLTSLRNVNMPDSINTIEVKTFSNCDFEFFTVGKNVTTIKEEAFSFCRNLKTLALHEGITEIEKDAFFNCASLKTVYFSGTKEEFAQISIGEGNECLTNAEIIYNQTYELPEIKNIDLTIQTPSRTEINFRDSITLHAQADLPEGGKMIWSYANNKPFRITPSEDGKECDLLAIDDGEAQIVAYAVDAYGRVISDFESITMKSNYNFFTVLIALIKKILGIQTVYPQFFG